MTASSRSRGRILHVVSTGERRGGEVFAEDLIRALGSSGLEQAAAVLRCSGPVRLRFDVPNVICGPDRVGPPPLGLHPATQMRLHRTLANWRPDVVVAHGGEALKSLSLGSWSGSLVYRRIGATPGWMAGRVRRRVYAHLMRRADAIVAVGAAVERETREALGPSHHRPLLTMIPNGVDAERVRPNATKTMARRALGIAVEDRVVLSIGALGAEKDPLATLAVARAVAPALPTLRVLMLGEGPLRSEVERTIAEWGLEGTVRLLGERPDVGDMIAAADVVLLTSRTEGQPASLIEAGLCGRPVVCSDVGGTSEIVVEDRTGYLVRPGDVRSFAERLRWILRDEQLANRMGLAARTRCSDRFEISSVARQYLKLLGGFLPGHATDSAMPLGAAGPRAERGNS